MLTESEIRYCMESGTKMSDIRHETFRLKLKLLLENMDNKVK